MKDKITSDDILGKKAVDPDGEILGVVIKLHINNSQKKIIGISIDQGFIKPDLFIGIDLVKFFGIDAVFLNRVPESKYNGMAVVTAEGNPVGTVSSVVKSGSRISEFIVIKHKTAFRRAKQTIKISQVREIGERIIIKEKSVIKETYD